jgi:hypothetical protein
MNNTTELTDLEFVRAFEACELSNESFHHRDHIRLAWIYLQSYGALEARRRMAAAIRKFAALHGNSEKYHETITLAWLRLVADAMTRVPRETSFDTLTTVSPELLDKRTIEKFYSTAALASETARTSWVEPDLQPLPCGVSG